MEFQEQEGSQMGIWEPAGNYQTTIKQNMAFIVLIIFNIANSIEAKSVNYRHFIKQPSKKSNYRKATIEKQL